MHIHDPHVNVRIKEGLGKVSVFQFPPLFPLRHVQYTEVGKAERARRRRCEVPSVSVPGRRTNNTAICFKYIISIFTGGEILLWDDDLIGECNELVGAASEQVFRRCAVSSVEEVKVILLSFFTVCYFEHVDCHNDITHYALGLR